MEGKKPHVSFLNLTQVPYNLEVTRFATDNDSVGSVIAKRSEQLNAAAVVIAKHTRGALQVHLVRQHTAHTSMQNTRQCKTYVNAKHTSMQNIHQCKAYINAKHTSMQNTRRVCSSLSTRHRLRWLSQRDPRHNAHSRSFADICALCVCNSAQQAFVVRCGMRVLQLSG